MPDCPTPPANATALSTATDREPLSVTGAAKVSGAELYESPNAAVPAIVSGLRIVRGVDASIAEILPRARTTGPVPNAPAATAPTLPSEATPTRTTPVARSNVVVPE